MSGGGSGGGIRFILLSILFATTTLYYDRSLVKETFKEYWNIDGTSGGGITFFDTTVNNNNNNNNKTSSRATEENGLEELVEIKSQELRSIGDDGDDSNSNSHITRTQNQTFSACLLIKDDNHRLREWLAYHYYALPLRYVVVAVDPGSKTSPTPVLNEWRERLNMTIIEWTDTNYTSSKLLPSPNDTIKRRIGKHRARQKIFYHACTRYLQAQNRTWTSYHDVDEYMMINGDLVESSKYQMSRPGFILNMTEYYRRRNYTELNITTEQELSWYQHFQQSHCITFGRALMGAVESTEEEIALDVPSFLDPIQFDTLRFRYQTSKRFKRDGLAKAIIDVSKVVERDYKNGGNPHRPLQMLCPDVWFNFNKKPIGIYHFLGSWEAYSYREDARDGKLRSYEKWEKLAKLKEGGSDDYLRPWIQGFVNLVGEETAKYLLRDVGLPRDYKKAHNISISSNITAPVLLQ